MEVLGDAGQRARSCVCTKPVPLSARLLSLTALTLLAYEDCVLSVARGEDAALRFLSA